MTLYELSLKLKEYDGTLPLFVYNEEGQLSCATIVDYSHEYDEYSIDSDDSQAMTVDRYLYFAACVKDANLPVYVWERTGGAMNPVSRVKALTDKVILYA